MMNYTLTPISEALPLELTHPLIREGHQQALAYRNRSYSPYSQFKVGCALYFRLNDFDQKTLQSMNLDDDKKSSFSGLWWGGCNVENMSYGATVCAERNALNSLIPFGIDLNKIKPLFMVLATETFPVSTPCGLCLQTLQEFLPSDFSIYLSDLQEARKHLTLQELLPHGFRGDFLKKTT